MAKTIKYTIFKTKWGYFALAATADRQLLLRSCLPCPTRKIGESHIAAGLDNPQLDKNLLKPLQNKIIAYFEGRPVKFDTPLTIDNLSPFTQKVLAACRKIPPGKTITYSQLAKMIGRPKASRAVGNALAKNPIPLIIPCHRVIRCDGSIGKFSAQGSTALKKKMIDLEKGNDQKAIWRIYSR